MSHTAEFLDLMAGLDVDARAALLTRHVQVHGESPMTESLRRLVDDAEQLVTDPASPVWDGLPRGIVDAFCDGNAAHHALSIDVWNTWVDVVNAARESGTVGIGTTDVTSPLEHEVRAVAASGATAAPRCPSCGVPSVGPCPNCERQQLHADHAEYDRHLYELDQDRPGYDRLRDDRDVAETSAREGAPSDRD